MNFATAIGDYTKEQLVQLLIHQQAMNAKLTHELAILKRQKFAATSEAYAGEQQRELFETLDIDLAAVTAEMEQLALRALQERHYEYAEWKVARVGIDYHVEVGAHG